MKKVTLLLVLIILTFAGTYAQGVPQGMKYQAVARNLIGSVIANQEISLKISLLTEGAGASVYYTEVHTVTTNQLGLFTLVVGEGKVEKGSFKNIPWSTENVWMEVALKDKGKLDFMKISSSKLFAVPYAFHAATAGELVSNSRGVIAGDASSTTTIQGTSPTTTTATTASGTNPSNGNSWNLGGNLGSVATQHFVGTADAVDLVLRTKSIERLRILANGGVLIRDDLEVKGITKITNNTQSTSTTTGALVVTGGVGIGGNLNVGGETNFNGGVTTKGISVTDNTENFVATITNTNEGEGDGLKIKLGRIHPLWNGTAYEGITADDYSPVYGAFQQQIDLVGGWITNKKVDITGGDLWNLVANTGKFLGGALCQLTNAISPTLNKEIGLPLDLATPINTQLSLPYNLANPINDALKLPMDFATPINNTLKLPLNLAAPINTALGLPIDLAAPINSALGLPYTIAGATIIPTISALTIPGISASSLTIPGIPTTALTIPSIPTTALTIPSIPTTALTIPAIPQIDCSSLPTIGMPNIKTTDVTNSLTKKNEFIRFADKDERVVGKIRAQSIGDYSAYLSSKEYLFTLVAAAGGIDIARGLISLAKEFKKMNDNYNRLGVEYISGNGDYAEWMQRENLEETISAGDIVAVKGGRITKDLRGAEQIMAVSTAPIVNANMPHENKVALGNSIAFMGQIPVKIMGSVTTGDFIVAKGNISGYGIAVKSANMTTEDFRLVVGRAWETMESEGPKMVNTLVGVQNNDFLKIIERYQQKIVTAEARVTSTEERLNAIEQKLNIGSSTKKNNQKK